MATIDNLEIQIQSDSSSAVSSINELASSLNRIKNAVKGGIGLKSVSNQISELDSSLKSIDSGSVSKIDRLAASLSKLSSVKISSSIGTQLKSISSNMSAMTLDGLYNLDKLGTALNPLSGLGKAGGLKSIITQLGKLPELATALNTVNFTQFTNDIQALSNALAPLASRLDITASAFTRLPANIRRTVSATRTIPSANREAEISYVNLWAKVHLTINVLRRAAGFLSSWITKSNQYIEDLNLFNVSMGKYAKEAKKYADIVSEAVGIDPGEFMRNQGIFNTVVKGFGVAEDRAYLMSKNLTQLGYDISSFYNIPFENSMEKLQSGIAGELEPLRRLGYDLSVARLQQEAYTLGINKKISAMTQAEKSELRYYAIMTQVTAAQGDMARTLESPANQLRVLSAQLKLASRALGNIFLPLLKLILPYAIAAAKVIRYLAECVASFFGIKLSDFSGVSEMEGLADNANNAANGLGKAGKAAKKLKNALLGIDELNIISEDKDSGKNKDGDGTGAGGLGIKLPEYDFLKNVKQQTDKIFEGMKKHLKDILPIVGSIGAAFAAWKIGEGISKVIGILKKIKVPKLSIKMIGLAALLDDIKEFRNTLKDIQENGLNFQNGASLIANGLGMIGDALILLGNTKVGGALKAIDGLLTIVSGAIGLGKDGFNWDDLSKITDGLSDLAIGIGAFQGNFALVAGGFALKSIKGIIKQMQNIITAIKTGDWSVVDWIDLAENAVIALIGFAGCLVKLKTISTGGKAAETIGNKLTGLKTATDTVGTTAGELNTSASTLTSKLKNLVINLGLGIAIIGEVAIGAILLVGAIYVLGKELNAVAKAWEPIVGKKGSGATVLKALGAGTLLLGAVGAAVYAIGEITVKGGGKLALAIGVGTAVLAEIGVATGAFLIEIWAVGKGLQKIEKKWAPVLEKEETIKDSLAKGTALLTAVGVATGALGAITLASGGTIPLAIAAGAALLGEVSLATVSFIKNLTAVAKSLGDDLAPELEKLNKKLPDLNDNTKDFVNYMTNFANEVVKYTEADVVAGLAATIDTIIGWFTEDPIDKLANDVSKINGQTKGLNEKLNVAVPELRKAKNLLTSYRKFLTQIEELTKTNVKLSDGMFVNMKEVGEKIVTGFVDGITSKRSDFENAASSLVDGFKTKLEESSTNSKTAIVNWATNIQIWFTNGNMGGINTTKWQDNAKSIITGFKDGITNNNVDSKVSITNWASDIIKWFTDKTFGDVNKDKWEQYAKDIIGSFKSSISQNKSDSESAVKGWGTSVIGWFNRPDKNTLKTEFKNIGKNVISGFTEGLGDYTLRSLAEQSIRNFAKSIISTAKSELQVHSPSRTFKGIGQFVVEGFNIGLTSKMSNTYSIMDEWIERVSSYEPELSLETSGFNSLRGGSYTNRVLAEHIYEQSSSYNGNHSSDSMGRTMREFYREYVEPTLKEIASDTKRQADKSEKTVVQIGNRTVTDAVIEQQEANGYSFI